MNTITIKLCAKFNNLLAPVCETLCQEAAVCGHHHPLHTRVVEDIFLEVIILANIFVYFCLKPQDLGPYVICAGF